MKSKKVFIKKKSNSSSFWKHVGIFILLFVLLQLVSLPLVFVVSKSMTLIISGIIGYYVAYVLLIIFAIHLYNRDKQFDEQKFRIQNLWWIISGLVIVLVLEKGLLYLSQILYNTNTSQNQETLLSILGTSKFVMYALLIGLVFLAPVLEETIFRGYLMSAIFKPNQWVLPIIVSGAVFSFAHAQSNILTFGVYMIMGMTLAFIYKKTGTLKSSILLHILNNLISIIPILIQFH